MPTEISKNSVDHHILRIPTGKEQFHHILITVKREISIYISDGPKHEIGNITVQAHYLTGPKSRHGLISGHLSSMGGSYDTFNKSVKITNGSVIIRNGYKGLGIGSFMFDVIVQWALKQDPSFKLAPIKVSSVDATDDNQARRNKFYANFGIFFGTPLNEGVIGGWSDPMVVGDLKSHSGWATRLERLDHLHGLWMIGDELQDLLLDTQNYKYKIEALREEILHLRRFKSRTTATAICVISALILALLISN